METDVKSHVVRAICGERSKDRDPRVVRTTELQVSVTPTSYAVRQKQPEVDFLLETLQKGNGIRIAVL
jgi:hypothetical protein